MAARWHHEEGEIEMAWPQGLVYRFPVERWRVDAEGRIEWYDADGSETLECGGGTVFVRFIAKPASAEDRSEAS